MPQSVSDSRSNAAEQIEHAARVVGRSPQARKVFDTIYSGKQRVKTVGFIANVTGLDRKQVLTHGKKFVDSHIVEKVREDGDTAYKKDDFYHRNKGRILSLAGDKKKLAAFPTKRNPSNGSAVSVVIQRRPDVPPPKRVTVDDIDSFSLVHKIKPAGNLSPTISEKRFKLGVRNIIGESGNFTDWGGEKNDLFTTRMKFRGKRVAAAFGFKGPGTKGPLVPGKLGKNGDQIQRLFETDADVFFVQYWREIEESVLNQMYGLAVAKCTLTRRKVCYGLIDGQDSNRLFAAYAVKFPTVKAAKNGSKASGSKKP